MPVLTVQPNDRVTFGIAHQDEHVLIVEKPARLVTTPGKAHESDSLLNGLFARFGARLQSLGAKRDFGLLHRLDRDTSGLVVVALTAAAYDRLREAFEGREVGKYYWAVTRAAPAKPTGVVKRPIAEETVRIDRYRTVKVAKISGAGKAAATAYRVLEASPMGALVEARAITGRLHQVRVHLDSIGATVLGDDTYGPESVRKAAPRLALHAHRVTLDHPVTGERIDVRSRWPRDLRSLLSRLGLNRPDSAGSEGDLEA
ncbi:MAG TPA: RluA family pseudouridine synthase [Phycisphaerales bacterium]|nr:RluA family pseudouridine synthase [Phycisphaerales bacterium]